jgi:hypothetical protein
VNQPGASGGHLADFSGQIEGSSFFFREKICREIAAGKFPARSRQYLVKPGGWPVPHSRGQPSTGKRGVSGWMIRRAGSGRSLTGAFGSVSDQGKGWGLPEGRAGLGSDLIILLSDTDVISGKELGVDDLI